MDFLVPKLDKGDEVVVLQDVTNKNDEVSTILDSYGNQIVRIEAALAGDFATFKNRLISAATKQYLFQIDADEIPKESLIKNLKKYLLKNEKSDAFNEPRINTLNGITPEFIQKWKWTVNDQGYINFPDYQMRILKLDKNIQWKNRVHEQLVNFEYLKMMPSDSEEFCLVHAKEFEKQKFQNDFYDSLEGS